MSTAVRPQPVHSTHWMRLIGIYIILLATAFLVVATLSAPGLRAALVPKPAGQVSLPVTATGRQFYWNEDGGFGFLLPPHWVVGEPQETAFGRLYPLGPAVLLSGPQGSSIIVADARRYTPEQLLAALCACGYMPAITDVTIGTDIPAKHAAFVGHGLARLETIVPTEWYVVARDGKLLAFSLYSPATLHSLSAVFATVRFDTDFVAGAEGLPAVEASRMALAKSLNMDPYEITAASAAAVDWPDACLGNPGVACADVITAGYRIMLQARGTTYEYHTNLDGSQILAAE